MEGFWRLRRLLFLIILLIASLSLQSVGTGRPTPSLMSPVNIPRFAKVEPQLLKQALSNLSMPERVDVPLRFVVHLEEQVDLGIYSRKMDPIVRRQEVVQTLQDTARHHQAPIQSYLSSRQAGGYVHSFNSYWIFNGLSVVADAQTLLELAQRPEVAIIRLDRRRRLLEEGWGVRDSHQTSEGVEWNVRRIRADVVWGALDIDGTGVVVANMDTGVDWQHPALLSGYRGYDPKGWSQHQGNWFCATDESYLYPGDGHGHGTHTMGLMVGEDGSSAIGVAPGARWITVKVFDNQGFTYDSWLHAGFQWLLAPEGDVALAPDVVSSSWGSDQGADTIFQPDVQALRAAGILPIFSAGNNGPGSGTIGSPASFPQAFAVGASDVNDYIASFSSRGPSPWSEVKPEVVAPGVDIRSSMPGGTYALANGTSMAAPHVAGTAALLLQAMPSLTVSETEQLLIRSARQLGTPDPNNDYGWGLVDAYSAVSSVLNTATISGTVISSVDGLPLAGATVQCAASDESRWAKVTTDEKGHYGMILAAGTYSLSVSAFAYNSQIETRLVIISGQIYVRDFSLDHKPTGMLLGRITEVETGSPLMATVEVAGTPVQAQSDPDSGLYSLDLPVGVYTMSVKAPGYRIWRTEPLVITAEQTVFRDVVLHSAPTILLVDSGSWYYGSQIGYFTHVLDNLDYLYDMWSIRQPFATTSDIPSTEDLSSYDVVIWSAPEDSPGYIGAGGTIADFLEAGGLLFITGQDIGYWDGGGTMAFSSYFREYLHARYVRDDSEVRVVDGVGPLFAGLFFAIQNGDGAGNQSYPDEIEVVNPDYAVSVLRYRGDGSAGHQVGLCQPYKALYLAFGFEAIDSYLARQEVMDRALGWLTSLRAPVGLELQVTSRQPQVVMAGRTASHTLRLRNTGDGGEGGAYDVSLGTSAWPITLTTPASQQAPVSPQTIDERQQLTLQLPPCYSTTLKVEVTIPAGAEQDIIQEVAVTARSQQEVWISDTDPGVSQTVTLTTKTPAQVLLVDDDRWYDQESRYRAALEAAEIAYDNWEIGWKSQAVDGSPSSATMAQYPILVWFTGYDWHETLTADEEIRLIEYLSQGGRLMLSSQDYLFTRGLTPLAVDYLGVLTHTEDLTTTMVFGVVESPIGDDLGPYHLIYPFPNWSDALTPTVATVPTFLGEHGYPIALARSREGGTTTSKAAFFAFPLEALAKNSTGEVMERTIGWLSWLGNSSLSVDKLNAEGGERLTYTAWLQNDGLGKVKASFEGVIPLHTLYVPGSATGGVILRDGTVFWEGVLKPHNDITVTYQVAVDSDLPAGTRVSNVSRFGYADGKLSFPRWVYIRVNTPDLSPSYVTSDRDEVKSGEVLSYHVSIRNEGLVDAPVTSLTVTLPSTMKTVSDSLIVEGGRSAVLRGDKIMWTGPVSVGHLVGITYQMVASPTVTDVRAVNSVEISDGLGASLHREISTTISPFRRYLLFVR